MPIFKPLHIFLPGIKQLVHIKEHILELWVSLRLTQPQLLPKLMILIWWEAPGKRGMAISWA